MSVLNTEHKRKSAIITTVILTLLVVGVFNYGMKYLDPPIEYGLAINFGNSEVGSGEPVQNTKKQAVQEQQEKAVEEQVKEISQETIQEEVITDDSAKNVPAIEKAKEQKKVVTEIPKKTAPKHKPRPSKQTTDALNSLLNGASEDGATKGEGDDKEKGVKGNQNGNPNSNKYYGNSGSGSGGNYNLSGRKALSKPIKKPDCEEEGTVVVNIEVNQNGKVIKAQVGGVKGSTSSAACLEKAAKEAALKTRWNADGEAPSKQRGTIIYKFSLSQ